MVALEGSSLTYFDPNRLINMRNLVNLFKINYINICREGKLVKAQTLLEHRLCNVLALIMNMCDRSC